MLADSGVELISGWARIVGPHEVEVDGRRISAERLLIATGGTPSHPGIEGIELAMSSNEILDLSSQPEHLLVLGAGYIAVEFAGIFAGFGGKVSLAYRADLPIRGFDEDIRRRLATAMTDRGVTLRRASRRSGWKNAANVSCARRRTAAPSRPMRCSRRWAAHPTPTVSGSTRSAWPPRRAAVRFRWINGRAPAYPASLPLAT